VVHRVTPQSAQPDLQTMLSVGIDDSFVEMLATRLAAHLDGGRCAAASPWMTVDEAADYLRWAVKRIRNLTSAREIPHRKQGGRVLYHRDELDAWLDRHYDGPGQPFPLNRPPAGSYHVSDTSMPRRRANAPGPDTGG
jgi:excisionase family DNA binding protein